MNVTCFGEYDERNEIDRACGFCPKRGDCMAATQTGQWQTHDDPHRDDLTPRSDPIDLVQNHSVPRAVMDRRELDLRTLTLISALEAWSYSLGKTLPKYVEDETRGVCEALKQEILK